MSMWHLRWHMTNVLVRAAIWIAPKGPARDVLLEHLEAFGNVILRRIAERRASEEKDRAARQGDGQ
jgi:hypothetical protein